MRNEYFYKPKSESMVDLGDAFDSLVQDESVRYLVSNSKGVNAEIYAPEVDWYFNNSKESLERKKNTLKKIYEIRTVAYEVARNVESSVRVGKSVLLISEVPQPELQSTLIEKGFVVVPVFTKNNCLVSGSLGNFLIQTHPKESEKATVEAAQIIWFNVPEQYQKMVGVYDPVVVGTHKAIDLVSENEGLYRYKNSIRQDWSICLQKNKREDICGKCVDICPEGAISKSPDDLRITLSNLQCVGCGQCVSICPTGSIDYAAVPRKSFNTLGVLYSDSMVLIVSETLPFDELTVDIPQKVLPYAVSSFGFLDEEYLLSLIYASSHPVVIYSDTLSSHQLAQIALINEVIERICQRKGVFVCHGVKELNETFKDIKALNIDPEILVNGELSKREKISSYLESMIGERDFGVVSPDVMQPYGSVHINESNCTLCLSCVDACTARAFVPHTEDNSLRFTPSLCVQCGYCEKICPESNCLSVVYNELVLAPAFFRPAMMAEDELFNCVECGVGFAPSKSITKIIELMTPKFGDDTLRIKSLSCCPDCKAKVMLEAMEVNI